MGQFFALFARYALPALLGWVGSDISNILMFKEARHEPGGVVGGITAIFRSHWMRYLIGGVGVVLGLYLWKYVFSKHVNIKSTKL